MLVWKLGRKSEVLIGFAACASNEKQVTLIRQYGDLGANEESFSIYKGTSSSGKYIYGHSYGYGNQEITTVVCLEPGETYYVSYYDSVGNGWYHGSHVEIKDGDHTIYQSGGIIGSSGSDTFLFPSKIESFISFVT